MNKDRLCEVYAYVQVTDVLCVAGFFVSTGDFFCTTSELGATDAGLVKHMEIEIKNKRTTHTHKSKDFVFKSPNIALMVDWT